MADSDTQRRHGRGEQSNTALAISIVIITTGVLIGALVFALLWLAEIDTSTIEQYVPSILIGVGIAGAAVLVTVVMILLYRAAYFRSKAFIRIQKGVKDLISEFNDLNIYADQLSLNILGGQTKQDFVGETANTSRWNYQHSGLFSRQNHNYIYHCSRSVVSSAQLDGFKYLCKYFNVDISEDSRNSANEMLGNFESYAESRHLLQEKRNDLFDKIKNDLPFLIRSFKKSLYKKLGLVDLDLKSVIYPRYIFQYTSSGGNSGLRYTLELSSPQLQKLVVWLDDKIKYKKSAQYQRMIMTADFREKIKSRDKYACKICKVSIKQEPTLLLEIDHIIPISKGGMSVEENLQCLCWKCNRSKGAKVAKA
ncbi:MAG: HNH endonuclease [Defluviitaleaceae bacterium]|nr:HNH endonuclease [Defluviitaleaceae bacterium]